MKYDFLSNGPEVSNPIWVWARRLVTDLNRRDVELADIDSGALIYNVRSAALTSAVTIGKDDTYLEFNTTSGSITQALPPVASNIGRVLIFKKIVSANTLTLDPNSAETIDSAATLAITTQWAVARIIGTNSGWRVI